MPETAEEIFAEAAGRAYLQKPESDLFSGVRGEGKWFESYSPATWRQMYGRMRAKGRLPRGVEPRTFAGALPELLPSELPGEPSLRPEIFVEVEGGALLPPAAEPRKAEELVREEPFSGVQGEIRVPEPLWETFRAISGEAELAPSFGEKAFEGAVGGVDLQLEFPGGGRVFVGYETGVPLGSEKEVLQPSLRRDEK